MKRSIDNFWESIPYFKLTEENKSYIASRMIECNKLLKHWNAHVPCRKIRYFRNQILNGSFNKVADFIPECLRTSFFDDCVKIRKIRAEKIESLENRTVEEAVVAGYGSLALRTIFNFNKKSSNFNMLFDMYQEAYIKIIDCMYAYTDDKICFSTFLCNSVKNLFYQMINEDSIVKIPYYEKKLLMDYNRHQKNSFITTNKVVGLEEYIDNSSLDKKQILKLQKVITSKKSKRINGIDESSNIDIPDRESCEFIASSNINSDSDSNEITIKQKVRESIMKANLNPREKEVLQYALNAEMKFGWKTELAGRMNLTKMRVSQIVKSAFGKVKNFILISERNAR